jgi:alkaline phosphatase D
MVLRYLFSIVLLLGFACSSTSQPDNPDASLQPTKIAFGSCAREFLPVPAFDAIVASEPDLFVWLGDIIYGDTHDMTVLKKKYDQQKNKPEYQRLLRSVPIIGVWDDHDYGINDGGKHYTKKEESKELCLDFLDVPPAAPVREHDGLYSSYDYQTHNKLIKIILLDTRYFRDTLYKDSETSNRYLINEDGDILGEAQWQWLEEELTNSTADFHIIGSGIQFLAEEQGFEKWANFPTARARMIELIQKINPKPLIFISGDRHMAEVSEMVVDGLPYPLIDFTASGLTHTWSQQWEEPNRYRVGELIAEKNFGLITIDWDGDRPKVVFEVRGVENKDSAEVVADTTYLTVNHTY